MPYSSCWVARQLYKSTKVITPNKTPPNIAPKSAMWFKLIDMSTAESVPTCEAEAAAIMTGPHSPWRPADVNVKRRTIDAKSHA